MKKIKRGIKIVAIFKSVFININSFSKPSCLMIIDDDYNIIKKAKINSFCSKICICTKSHKLKLIASYSCQAIYKTICLNNFKCQNIFVNFKLNAISQQKAYNVITLLDANYGLPVENAILCFRS